MMSVDWAGDFCCVLTANRWWYRSWEDYWLSFSI